MPLNYELLLDRFVDPVIVVDQTDIILYSNEAVERLLGWSSDDLIGRPLSAILPHRLHGTRSGSFVAHLDLPLRVPLAARDGSEVDVDVSLTAVSDPGCGDLVVGCLRDARRRLELERREERLRDQLEFLSAITRALAGGVLAFDRHGHIAFVNAAAEEMLGSSQAELLGRDVHQVVHHQPVHNIPETPEQCELCQAIDMHVIARVADDLFARQDGTTFPVAYTVSTLDVQGYPVGGTLAFQDMTERKQVEEAVRHQALHDPLTDLPNRLLLQDRLNQAVLTARRGRTPVALLFMDLDRFKVVNDSLGHAQGDAVLQEIGERIRRSLRESDTVARLGGDEFAVVLPGADREGAISTVHKILQVVAEPFTLSGRRFDIGASLGIALFPDHGFDADQLMRRADVAMYVAKRARRGYTVYNPTAGESTPAPIADGAG